MLSPDASLTVYDAANHLNWLANANLPATNRFGLPVCNGAAANLKACINASGSMTYQAAVAWVAAMNAANYLGHNNWQIPTNPLVDNSCPLVGPNGGSFGFNCTASALGSLFYNGLGLAASNTAVPIPGNTVGPFTNFQPYIYWSGSASAQTFSFNSGYVGSNTETNYLYVLPMIPGKIAGTPAAVGVGLQVNPGSQTVYDPVANVTWLANANIAATNTFGLPVCKSQGSPKICVNPDGAMNTGSASQFVANMNSYNATGYLGQTNWQLPPLDPTSCTEYNCSGSGNPMGELYYNQLHLAEGTPVVAAPDIAVGPFHNIQPYLYWACQALTIQDACQPDSNGPAPGFEWSFSFGNGFEGTDIFVNDLYVTAYFPGPPAATSGVEIAEVANAEGESPLIAPNTWVEIKGVNLAPPGDSRTWQTADFTAGQMPTQLDHVSATVNGKSAFVYFISPTQINILTPPDPISGAVQVVVTSNGTVSASSTPHRHKPFPLVLRLQWRALHRRHARRWPPARTRHALSRFHHSGPTRRDDCALRQRFRRHLRCPSPVAPCRNRGTHGLLPLRSPSGASPRKCNSPGLVAPGQFQFNVVVPASLGNGDQLVTATYGGLSTQPATADQRAQWRYTSDCDV